MKNVAKFAAVALIAAPTFASAGNMTAPMEDNTVYVDPTPAGSSGSMGSMGSGAAIVGLIALAAIAASSGS